MYVYIDLYAFCLINLVRILWQGLDDTTIVESFGVN